MNQHPFYPDLHALSNNNPVMDLMSYPVLAPEDLEAELTQLLNESHHQQQQPSSSFQEQEETTCNTWQQTSVTDLPFLTTTTPLPTQAPNMEIPLPPPTTSMPPKPKPGRPRKSSTAKTTSTTSTPYSLPIKKKKMMSSDSGVSAVVDSSGSGEVTKELDIRERNRRAAIATRARKKAYVSGLETRVSQLEQYTSTLRAELAAAKDMIAKLTGSSSWSPTMNASNSASSNNDVKLDLMMDAQLPSSPQNSETSSTSGGSALALMVFLFAFGLFCTTASGPMSASASSSPFDQSQPMWQSRILNSFTPETSIPSSSTSTPTSAGDGTASQVTSDPPCYLEGGDAPVPKYNPSKYRYNTLRLDGSGRAFKCPVRV